MKVIIAGSRSIMDYKTLELAIEASAIHNNFGITEVVSGGASGIDSLGELWAMDNGVEVRRFPAYWNLYGKSAGIRRNIQMGDYADALIAVWDGQSRGTKQMIDYARKKDLIVFVYEVK